MFFTERNKIVVLCNTVVALLHIRKYIKDVKVGKQ